MLKEDHFPTPTISKAMWYKHTTIHHVTSGTFLEVAKPRVCSWSKSGELPRYLLQELAALQEISRLEVIEVHMGSSWLELIQSKSWILVFQSLPISILDSVYHLDQYNFIVRSDA